MKNVAVDSHFGSSIVIWQGVILDYTIKPLKNEDYPNTSIATMVFPYSKQSFVDLANRYMELMNDPTINISLIPDAIERRLYKSTIRLTLDTVYNLIAATTVPFLLYVLPRQMESLHPGADGPPAFSEITAPVMRAIFYPAVIGFIAIAWLLYRQRVRAAIIKERH